MELPDGRTLAFAEAGDPEGRPVVYFHGAPTSRLDIALFEIDALRAPGARIIAPDRPGYGGSSPHPGRSWVDWPIDVVALADHLGIARFAVMGMSSGGPYSVACAAMLPDHVVAAAVLSGVTDMGWPDAWDGFLESEAALMRVGDEDRARVWCDEHYGPDGAGFFGETDGMAPADEALMGDATIATPLMTSMIEAFHQGVAGYAQDVTVQGRPWSFDAGTIRTPVFVYHGEADTLAPVAHARHTAGLIPGSTLATFPEQGHLSVMTEAPRLIEHLVAAF